VEDADLDGRDAGFKEKIHNLKNKRKAAIFAHNCQPAEVQDIADFVGDSWQISLQSVQSSAEVIVVCGVDHIAQTASIMCPDKNILLPETNAVCPLCGMITADRLRQKKKEHPLAKVVCYIKSPAEVKAEADICCTSANADRIIRNMEKYPEIIFAPDQYLGDEICRGTGREMILWPGYCPSDVKISTEDILKCRAEHPGAKVVVHTQCTPQVKALSDFIGSTAEIIGFVDQTRAEEVVVGAEVGMLHRLEYLHPEKRFVLASERAVCGKMKLVTLENILWSLESGTHLVKVPDDIRQKAKSAIDNMLNERLPDEG
jgi:quinolinate synthase